MRLLLFSLIVLSSCKTTTYFISRHAEKSSGSGEVQLTAEGEKQAMDLQTYLKGKAIKAIYSTNYNRTKATAAPTAELFELSTIIYAPGAATNTLVDSLKGNNKKNILIIGHSNTVDDIVNRFTGTATINDLPESEYGSLFIVKKKGNSYTVEKVTVPKTTPR